jgi:hypothetical protein
MHRLASLVVHGFACPKTAEFEADHAAARRLEHGACCRADASRCFVGTVEVQGHVSGQGQPLLKFFGRSLNELANEPGEV